MRSLLLRALPILLALSLLPLSAATAQSATTVTYPAGWNMVGAVTGTALTGADGVFAYDGGGYVPIPSATLTTCEGAWAYFSRQTTVTLAATPPAYATP